MATTAGVGIEGAIAAGALSEQGAAGSFPCEEVGAEGVGVGAFEQFARAYAGDALAGERFEQGAVHVPILARQSQVAGSGRYSTSTDPRRERIRSHSSSSHSLTKVTALPVLPARAVRPIRWMYSSEF